MLFLLKAHVDSQMRLEKSLWPDYGPAVLKAATTLNGTLQVYTPDMLHHVMSESHYVVAALPSTPETIGYISAEAIAGMRSDAVFINIGRGKTVDEEALIKGQLPHISFTAAA